MAPERNLREDKFPGVLPGLEGPVALEISDRVGGQHLLQRGRLRQVGQALYLDLLRLQPLGLLLLQLREALFVRDHLRVVDQVGEPLEPHPGLPGHLVRQIVPHVRAPRPVVLALVLHGLEGCAFGLQAQQVVELLVIPAEVDERVDRLDVLLLVLDGEEDDPIHPLFGRLNTLVSFHGTGASKNVSKVFSLQPQELEPNRLGLVAEHRVSELHFAASRA